MPASSRGKAAKTVKHKYCFIPPAIAFELFGCNFFPVLGGRSRYAPAGTQTLFADAISAFATFVEMLTLCSPSLLRGMA